MRRRWQRRPRTRAADGPPVHARARHPETQLQAVRDLGGQHQRGGWGGGVGHSTQQTNGLKRAERAHPGRGGEGGGVRCGAVSGSCVHAMVPCTRRGRRRPRHARAKQGHQKRQHKRGRQPCTNFLHDLRRQRGHLQHTHEEGDDGVRRGQRPVQGSLHHARFTPRPRQPTGMLPTPTAPTQGGNHITSTWAEQRALVAGARCARTSVTGTFQASGPRVMASNTCSRRSTTPTGMAAKRRAVHRTQYTACAHQNKRRAGAKGKAQADPQLGNTPTAQERVGVGTMQDRKLLPAPAINEQRTECSFPECSRPVAYAVNLNVHIVLQWRSTGNSSSSRNRGSIGYLVATNSSLEVREPQGGPGCEQTAPAPARPAALQGAVARLPGQTRRQLRLAWPPSLRWRTAAGTIATAAADHSHHTQAVQRSVRAHAEEEASSKQTGSARRTASFVDPTLVRMLDSAFSVSSCSFRIKSFHSLACESHSHSQQPTPPTDCLEQ